MHPKQGNLGVSAAARRWQRCVSENTRQVRATETDRNGRVIAHVACDGADSGAQQVRSGMAWVYDRYVVDRTLYDSQQQAQQERLGLWQDTAPVPPWTWRRERRSAS